jgi:hypothetical protein
VFFVFARRLLQGILTVLAESCSLLTANTHRVSNIDSISNLMTASEAIAMAYRMSSVLQHFTFAERCFSPVIKNRRCHSAVV